MEVTVYRHVADADVKAVVARVQDAPAEAGAESGSAQSLAQLEQKLERVQALGLDAQAYKIERQLREAARQREDLGRLDPGLFYPALSPAEWRAWAWFLPRVYEDLRRYHFDEIPEQALAELEFARSLSLFDAIWIRTPEQSHADPILVGVRAGQPYLLARWGESLVPFTEVERRAARRRWGMYGLRVAPAVLGFGGLHVFLVALEHNSAAGFVVGIVSMVVAGFCGCLLADLGWGRPDNLDLPLYVARD